MKDSRKGPLAWFAANHVAANVLMIFVLVSGALALASVVIEVFPEVDTDTVTIRVPYRGASPAEAEEGVCVRVEEAIASIEGIKRIRSVAQENMGVVNRRLVWMTQIQPLNVHLLMLSPSVKQSIDSSKMTPKLQNS